MRWPALGNGFAIVLALAAALLAAGCGGAGEGGEELRIYVSHSWQSEEDLRAYQLALRDEGERAGSFTVKIVALKADVTQIRSSTQASVERNARRAAADERAIAYLGDGTSANTIFSMPITNRAGLLQVCPSCTYVGLTRKEGALAGDPERLYPTGRRHFIRIGPADHLQSAALVDYLQREGADRLLAVHDDQEYGTGLARLVARAAPRAGITLNSPPHEPRGDIRVEARRAAAGAAALVALGHFGGSDKVLERAAKAAPGLLIFSGDSNANGRFAAAVKDVGSQFRLTGPARPDPANRAAATFVKRFTKVYGFAPSPNSYLAYEAMRRVIQAIRAAGERADERAAVVDAMFAAPEEDTLVGRYRFDRNGDSTLTGFGAYRVKDGKLVYDGQLGVGPAHLRGQPAAEG